MSSKAKKSRISFLISPKNLNNTQLINKLKKVYLSFPIHPFLFAIFPVLFLYTHNINELLINVIFKPILLILILTSVSFIILKLLIKDRNKVGFVLSLFLILFFSYGHIQNVVGDFTYAFWGFSVGPDKIIFSTWITIFLLGTYFFIKTIRNLQSLTNFLNIAVVFLVIISMVNLIFHEYQTKTTVAQENGLTKTLNTETKNLVTPEKPRDIYYLIFDRYASNSTLKDFFKFDNSEFTNYLTNKGFYVATESKANYPKTFLSLASSLNMEHLTYLEKKFGDNTGNQSLVYPMLEDYKVWRLLKTRGYKFIHLGDAWEPTRINKYADINFNYFANTDEFSRRLLETTALYPILRQSFQNFSRTDKMIANDRYKFDKLAEIPNIEGPKFVFAHMLTTHAPYVLDKNGKRLSKEELAKRRAGENYINQLIFANKKIQATVDAILAKSNPKPIIIIQSDEGPFAHREYKGGAGGGIDWRELSAEALKVHMRILNAYYLPDVDKKVLYPSITPVNTFRLIFNSYFNTDFKLLPDTSYAFESASRIYKFFDITDKIR